MNYLYNESPSGKSTVWLNGIKVDIEPLKYEPLDNQTYNEAQGYLRAFSNLKIVPKDFIDNLNAGRAGTSVAAPVYNNQVNQQSVAAPAVTEVLNENGDTIAVYKTPIYNTRLEVVDQIGIMYNETKKEVIISGINIPVKIVNKNKPVEPKVEVLVVQTRQVINEYGEVIGSKVVEPVIKAEVIGTSVFGAVLDESNFVEEAPENPVLAYNAMLNARKADTYNDMAAQVNEIKKVDETNEARAKAGKLPKVVK